MKTEWTRDEIFSVKCKLDRLLERMKYNSDFYNHPALDSNISVQFKLAYIELSTIVEILEGDKWEMKEAHPQSGDYGMHWYLKEK